MLHVYKRSSQPLQPWNMIHVGGVNNIAPNVKARYLVLWRAEVVQGEDAWHYVFEFDTRESLQIGDLARMLSGTPDMSAYPDGADWASWLNQDWTIIDEHRRWEILSGNLPGGEQLSRAKITTLRIGPHGR